MSVFLYSHMCNFDAHYVCRRFHKFDYAHNLCHMIDMYRGVATLNKLIIIEGAAKGKIKGRYSTLVS